MSEKSLLELMAVTSSAVRALDKSCSSKSSSTENESETSMTRLEKRQNVENQHTAVIEDCKESCNSDVEKTASGTHQCQVNKINNSQIPGNRDDSDHSTTASDVLIRSSTGGINGKSTQQSQSINSSVSSQGSKNEHNDTHSGFVKVTKQPLREISFPQQSWGGKSTQTGNTGKSAFLTKNNSNISRVQLSSQADDVKNRKKAASKLHHSLQIGKGQVGIRIDVSQGPHGADSLPSYKVERHHKEKKTTSTSSSDLQSVNPNFLSKAMNVSSLDIKTASKLYSDVSPLMETGWTDHDNNGPSDYIETENLLYQVSRHDRPTMAQTFPEAREKADEAFIDDDESVCSSQPEIVTVEERVVNISSQAFLLSDVEDNASDVCSVKTNRPQSFPSRPQSFPRAKPPSTKPGPTLKQGALNTGPAVVKPPKGDELEIQKFSFTEKQQEIRDILAKRAVHSKPVRRVVQPKMVSVPASGDDTNKNNNMDPDTDQRATVSVGNMDSITAAVAASAAVAATQPFLKLQQELENKMQTLLAEMERVQKHSSTDQGSGNPRLEQLEQQVRELTEHRLQHLETIQSQQMQLQAHLLSMSRSLSGPRRQHHPPPHSSSQHQAYFPVGQPYSRAMVERELMKGRLEGQEAGRWSVGREEAESVLDTPNPRTQPPRPSIFGGEKGGLLKEILNAEPSPQLNTTFNLPGDEVTPARLCRSRTLREESPVDKARKLMLDLSHLEEQTAQSLTADLRSGRHRHLVEPEQPAPLEQYLKCVHDPNITPYPELRQRGRGSYSPIKSTTASTLASSPAKHRHAPVHDRYGEARNVLQAVTQEKETLEKNMELLMHARPNVDVDTLIRAISGSDRSDLSRIQKMVEKKISSLQDEVKSEMERDLLHGGPAKAATIYDASKKPAKGSKSSVGFGSGTVRMSSTERGLHKSRSETSAVVSKTHQSGSTRVSKARPAPTKSNIPYNDETAMTKIYGKALYQKGRTTVRDPYLHFQNQAKQRAFRIPSPQRPDNVLKVQSAKIQTSSLETTQGPQLHTQVASCQSSAPRQYYFTPAAGYVPVTSAAAAVAGQLVPMAVPLGRPRTQTGLAPGHTTAATTAVSSTTTPPLRPLVSAASNVVLMSVSADPSTATATQHLPELGKQVLPSVDIDTLSPPSTPAGSDIHIERPEHGSNTQYVETMHYQDGNDESADEGDKTLTDDYSDSEAQYGTGIALPGYHQPTLAAMPANPDRASQLSRTHAGALQLREEGQVAWEERCDELADELRSRDLLQNKARTWVEQELMARLLMRMHPLMTAQPDPELVENAECESLPDDESIMVDETIGQRGLQLFIDAGQPVNNALVSALMREVIAEKVGTILGRRQDEDFADGASKAFKKYGTYPEASMDEEMPFVVPSGSVQRVATPQPTPCCSPVPAFISQHAPVTPPLTPPPPPLPPRQKAPVKDFSESSEGALTVPMATTLHIQESQPVPQPAVISEESETELSASLDFSEELRLLDAKGRPPPVLFADGVSEARCDVSTPPASPPPPSPPHLAPVSAPTPQPSPPPVAERWSKAQLQGVSGLEVEVSPPPSVVADSLQAVPKLDHQQPGNTALTPPPPLMVSVAVNTEGKAAQRPPPPRDQESDSESVSSPSSVTDTVNQSVSEGQWLISKSEGQVMVIPGLIEEGYRQTGFAVWRQRGAGDVSTASTLHEAEDIDFDDTDVSRSEGEWMHKGATVNPEADPVLALLAQHQAPAAPTTFHQYDLPPGRVQQMLSLSDLSSGEFHNHNAKGSKGWYPGFQQSQGEMSDGQLLTAGALPSGVTAVVPKPRWEAGVTAVVPKPGPEAGVTAVVPKPGPEARGGQRPQGHERSRSASPPGRRAAAGAGSLALPGAQQLYQPVASGLPSGYTKRPLKSALVRSSDDSRFSRGSDSDANRHSIGNDPGLDLATRTVTPDQMNLDALLQSEKYTLRSNTSSRPASTKKSVDFDLSNTYQSSRRDSFRSEDSYSDPVDNEPSGGLYSLGQSLSLNYTYKETGSLSDMELPTTDFPTPDSRTPDLRMEVTLPTTGDGPESDVSEIELSDNDF